jgi:hypothetical protein
MKAAHSEMNDACMHSCAIVSRPFHGARHKGQIGGVQVHLEELLAMWRSAHTDPLDPDKSLLFLQRRLGDASELDHAWCRQECVFHRLISKFPQ